jgi:hypothetical protein
MEPERAWMIGVMPAGKGTSGRGTVPITGWVACAFTLAVSQKRVQ